VADAAAAAQAAAEAAAQAAVAAQAAAAAAAEAAATPTADATSLPATTPSADPVTPETGNLDARFVLWREFCTQYAISVDTLPSQLSGAARDEWEKIKDSNLHKPENKKEGV
ncbi:MAG: hypothetical protein H0V88_14905, partial [Pyrinomonadaceae bacterium]|nr:hypothetical protein [Pyrinomonadaceae bacterium]